MKRLEDLKQFVPRLRRYSRALATNSADPGIIADELVQSALLKTINMETTVRGDLNIHLFRLLTQLHREMLRSGKSKTNGISEKIQLLRDASQQDPKNAARQPQNHATPLNSVIQSFLTQRRTLPQSRAPLVRASPDNEQSEPAQPQSAWTSLNGESMQAGAARSQEMKTRASKCFGASNKIDYFEPQRERAIAALKSLRLDEKEAYLLVVLEGFTYATAAAILCISKTALTVRLMRARAALTTSNLLAGKPKSREVSRLFLVK